jgi:3-hydroxyisobutyrate dehydrogenase
MRIGFVGLGNMGVPMAANLARSSHELLVHDVEFSRAQKFVTAHGGKAAASLSELGAAEVVITMLPNGHVVRDVYMGPGGLATALQSGAIAVDMSSSDPAGTRQLGAELALRGIALVDAPVSGAVPRATDGTLAIMIGADDADVRARVKPVLSLLGNRLFDVGPLGAGHAMKCLNNYMAAAGYACAAEALLAGKRFGLDPTRMLEVINASTGRNFNTEVVLQEHVVNRRYATGFSLGLLAKDVGIAANLMRSVNLDAPVAAQINERYKTALGRLGTMRDNSEAILAWDNNNQEP